MDDLQHSALAAMPKIRHAFIIRPALPPSPFGGGRQLTPTGGAQVMKSLDWGAGSTFSLLTRQHTTRVVGAVDAGWRGAIAGVLEKCLAVMVTLGARAERLLAVLAPGTAQASDKVGPDLRAQFLAERPDNARFFVASKQAGRPCSLRPAGRRQRCPAPGRDRRGGDPRLRPTMQTCWRPSCWTIAG